jgi:hypothetical protein
MVPLLDLLWPLLLATCAVFVVSGVLRRVLPRRAELVHVQEAVAAGIRELALRPGDYALPPAPDNDRSRRPPVYQLTVTPGGTTASRWEGHAAYHLAVNILVAYLAGLALLPGADFDTVFRFTTSAAFLGYCSTSIHGWLSERRSWRTVWKPACRGLVCSLVAGCIFACLWPVQ